MCLGVCSVCMCVCLRVCWFQVVCLGVCSVCMCVCLRVCWCQGVCLGVRIVCMYVCLSTCVLVSGCVSHLKGKTPFFLRLFAFEDGKALRSFEMSK